MPITIQAMTAERYPILLRALRKDEITGSHKPLAKSRTLRTVDISHRLYPRQRTCNQDMTLTIAGTSFDQHQYDDRGDVLYLSVGPPREAARTIATPEGHAVDYDETGAVIGMTLVNVQFLLDRDGMLTLSLPPEHITAEALATVLVAA
jgi:uncharacterized protein YuzE